MGCGASSSIAPGVPDAMPSPAFADPYIRTATGKRRISGNLSDNASTAPSSSASWVSHAYASRAQERAPGGSSKPSSSRGSSPGRSHTRGESVLLDGPPSTDKEKLVAHLLGNFTPGQSVNDGSMASIRRSSDTQLHLLPLEVLSRRRATWS